MKKHHYTLIVLLLIINISLLTVVIENTYALNTKLVDNNYKQTIENLNKEYNNTLKEVNKILDEPISSIEELNTYYTEITNSVEDFKKNNEELKTKKTNLEKQQKNLNKEYNNLKLISEQNNTYTIKNVPTINQYKEGFPTGCESTALTILLNYYNVNIKTKDVVNKLKKGRQPYRENGTLYGGNPYIEFVGNPKNKGSYGTYEKAIIDVANEYKSGIINGTGMNLSQVLKLVKENRPVLVWNSINLALPYKSASWIHKETNKKITWIANEHALVVVGYSESKIIVSDPITGTIRKFDRKTFEKRYNTFGKRAIYY